MGVCVGMEDVGWMGGCVGVLVGLWGVPVGHCGAHVCVCAVIRLWVGVSKLPIRL